MRGGNKLVNIHIGWMCIRLQSFIPWLDLEKLIHVLSGIFLKHSLSMIILFYLIAKRMESPKQLFFFATNRNATLVIIKAQIPVTIFPWNGKPNIHSVTPSDHARKRSVVKFLECWLPDKKHLLNSFACFSKNVYQTILDRQRYFNSKSPDICCLWWQGKRPVISDLFLIFSLMIPMHHHDKQ